MRPLNQLRERRSELERIAASCATGCDHIYDAIHEITSQIIERKVRQIPNVEKYIINYTKGTVDIFFDGIHSKTYLLKELKQ